MRTIFADPTPRWVPFVAAAMIVIAVWIGGIWQGDDFAFISKLAVGLGCVFFVLIFFQGRFFWKGQVATLSGDGQRYEALISIWVGRGKRVAFTPAEATNWSAVASSSRKEGEPAKLATIHFTVKGREYDLSFVNPKVIDLEGLSAINPGYFAKVKADYPALQSTAG
jgi:hypothetical protein